MVRLLRCSCQNKHLYSRMSPIYIWYICAYWQHIYYILAPVVCIYMVYWGTYCILAPTALQLPAYISYVGAYRLYIRGVFGHVLYIGNDGIPELCPMRNSKDDSIYNMLYHIMYTVYGACRTAVACVYTVYCGVSCIWEYRKACIVGVYGSCTNAALTVACVYIVYWGVSCNGNIERRIL